jgi:hypothetical protein
LKRLLSIFVVLALVPWVSGCSVEVNGDNSKDEASETSASGQRAELESAIRRELPTQLRQSFGQSVFIRQVGCTTSGQNQFDCLARVSAANEQGGLETVSIPISGSCDFRSCIWRTEGP